MLNHKFNKKLILKHQKLKYPNKIKDHSKEKELKLILMNKIIIGFVKLVGT